MTPSAKIRRGSHCLHCGQWMRGGGAYRGRQTVAVLNLLRARAGGIVNYGEIVEHLWGDDEAGGQIDPNRQISVYVFHLRRMGYPIKTIWGRGLQFAPTLWEVPTPKLKAVA